MQNAMSVNGEAMSVSRRTLLAGAVASAAALVTQDVSPPATLAKGETIASMFAEWLAACEACDNSVGEAESQRTYAVCARLQNRITAMRPVTAREAAMQFVAETHDNGCEYRESFYRRLRRLAMEG